MQWISRKFLVKVITFYYSQKNVQALNMYFEIQNQSKIQVEFKLLNIFGKHSIVCQNLKLKPQIVNKKDSLIHVQSCKIAMLEIAVDSSKQELLSAKVNGVKLALILNKNIQVSSSTKKEGQKPEIQQFKKMVSTQQTHQKIAYFQGSAFKKMIMQHILRKTSLSIQNVDISLKYAQNPSPKYIGIKLSQLNIKQRMVINKKKNQQNHKQQEIECKINNFSIYLGMQIQNQIKLKQTFKKEIVKSSNKEIKKCMLLEKNQVAIYYNQGSNTVSVMSQLLNFNISAFYVKELLTMIDQIKPLLSKAPKLRPGKGDKITLVKQVSVGTIQWWKYIGTRLVQKFKKKQQFNIIQNRQYKLYLYCLLYCYTYGRQQNLLNYILAYQKYKKSMYIMNSHKFIIQKIYKIQAGNLQPLEQMELKGFVSFLSIRPKRFQKKAQTNNITNIKKVFFKNQQQQTKLSIERFFNFDNFKKIKYEDIRKSSVFINFSNCIKFINQYQKENKKVLNLFLNINSLRFNLVQTNQQKKMHKDIYLQHPHQFIFNKQILMNNYYFQHIKNSQYVQQNQLILQKPSVKKEQNNQKNKSPHHHKRSSSQPVITLYIEQINLQKNESGFTFNIAHIKGHQLITKQKILDLKHLIVKNIKIERYSQKQGNIVNSGNLLEVRLNSVFANLTVKSVEKLLMFKTFIEKNENSSNHNNSFQKNQEKEQNDFLNNFMKKKIISDNIFNSKENQSIYVLIQNICLVTSAFDRDKIFQINLNHIEYYHPLSQNQKISLQKIEIKRTRLQNLKNKSWKKLDQNQSIILQNDRSFTGVISEKYKQIVNPNYFQYVKQYAKQKDKLLKQAPMIHHQASSVFNIIIPFLFIQLSCQDIYYIKLMIKFWKQLFQNPYLFPPKMKVKDTIQQANKSYKDNSVFQLIKELQKNTKLEFQTHVKLDGIQFIFNGDNPMSQEEDYSGQNRILTIMVDTISYDASEKLKQDKKTVTVRNIYVRNLLGKDEINFSALEDVFKQQIQKKCKLIKRNSLNTPQSHNLIMYNHFAQGFQDEDTRPFIELETSTKMNIEKLQGHNNINVSVKALQMFHEPKYFRVLVEVFSKLQEMAVKVYEDDRGKIFDKSFIKQNNQMRQFQQQLQLKRETKQILYSKDFNVINSLSVQIQKINIIILLECEPIYCIALDQIYLNHKTENYITSINFNIRNLYVIDISLTNGPHSIIIQSTKSPILINYTTYNCQLLKQRYKRSALMKVELNNAQIHYLNKKIMQFISFINQLKQDILGKSIPQSAQSAQQSQKKQSDNNSYPFCYQIIVKNSKVFLYRNSLSKQKLDACINTIFVTNYKTKTSEETLKRMSRQSYNAATGSFSKRDRFNSQTTNNFKTQNNNLNTSRTTNVYKTMNEYNTQQPQQTSFSIEQQQLNNQTLYEQMQQIQHDNFKSFIQQDIQQLNHNTSNIYIDIYQLAIQGRHRPKQILIGDMHLIFHNIQLDIVIPKLDMCMDNDDFRLLIRFTQQNFGQQDRYFHVNPILMTDKYEKFVTKFFVEVIKMTIIKGDYGLYEKIDLEYSQSNKKRQKQGKGKGKDRNGQEKEELNILTLIQLAGRDVSYSNGQKTDQITIGDIFAQNQNMIQFIQRYQISPTDPQIKVKPHKIQRSQQYFTYYKEVFDLFSKLGGQGADFVQSDFDQNEEQQRKKKDYKNSKNYKGQKLMQWFRGMCQKCFKFIKRQPQPVSPYDIAKAILQQKMHERRRSQNMIQQHTLFCNGDYNCSHIFDQKQIIRLENKVSPQIFQPLYKPSYKNQMYFRMDMETTKQKKMYVLLKDMVLTYDINKGLLDLSSFFSKPYGPYEDVDPPFVSSNFNNFRPLQMYIQLKNSKIQMKKQFKRLQSQKFQKIDSTQKITILLDMIYNMQNLGDLTKGPGKSIKQADVIFQLYHTIQKFGKAQYIELSNLLEIIYKNQAKISYKRIEKTHFNQNIIMKPFFDKELNLSIHLPAFYIKSLQQIYEHNFSKAQVGQKQQTSFMRQNQNLSIQKQNQLKKQKQQQQKEKTNKSGGSKKVAQQLASKIDTKKQKIKQKNIQSSITNRKIYIPSLCINIDSKLKFPFLKFKMNNFMMVNIYENIVTSQKSKIQITSELSVDYWNLHLCDFQPFLEPWNMKCILKNIKRENTLSKKIKIESFNNNPLKEDKDNSTQNPNSLNVNISAALFHTIKELELKYYQGKDQKQEECIDVTFVGLESLLGMEKAEQNQKIKKGFKYQAKRGHFPQSMKNFFGRKFIVQSDVIRKKPNQSKLEHFHQEGRIYNLYHSYFDHCKRRKIICYRTPFRLINLFNQPLKLFFKIKKKSKDRYNPEFLCLSQIVKKGEYFPIPSLIYKQDFFLKIKKFLIKTKKNLSQKENQKAVKHQQEILRQTELDLFMSIQYLMQISAQRKDFKKNKDSKLLNFLFAQDRTKHRYIDNRDILISVDKSVLALICTKSQYDNEKEKNKLPFYDTLIAIVSPIEITNNSPVSMTLILNGRKELKLPVKKSTFIHQDLNIQNIHQTVIQFKQHILHRQFTFLKKQHQNHTYFMQIDRMQSVNVKVIKQTTSTFSIQIFADWIIENKTQQEFELDYGTKLFPIDRKSLSSIAMEDYNHGKKIQMKLNIYSPDNQKQYPYPLITNGTQAIQIITMYKRVSQQYQETILRRKQALKKDVKCLCIKKYPFDQKTHQKQSNSAFETYHIVLKISQEQDCKYTKKITIMYKTKIRNKTNKILTLYQYDKTFRIIEIKPEEEMCVWGYDFLPEHYLIGKREFIDQTDINLRAHYPAQCQQLSQLFTFDQSMGKLMTVRFPIKLKNGVSEEVYHKYFQYLKMDIIQQDHSSMYQITEVNADSNDEFPIYIHNTTDENIKIYENNNEFVVKPKSKVPFSWSDLVHNRHQIAVQIGDIKKTYSFKQNQQFQPLIIKQESGLQLNNPVIAEPKSNFHKEVCRIKYGLIEGKFETIIDIKEMLLIIMTGLQGIEYKFDMKNAVKMTTSAQSIELNLGPKQQPLIIYPSNQTYETWLSYLNFTINQDIRTKISFTIQTYKNSRLFFFHNVDLGRQNDYLTSTQNYCIMDLFISVINQKPQEVLLIHAGDIRYTRQDRICRLGYDNYQIQKCDRKIQVKQIKINNQLDNAVNPVILTQIKKSKTPFIAVITKKRNLVKSQEDLSQFEFKDELITHYQSFRFFLDQAQAMVQATLIPKILNLKNQMQKIQIQYKIDEVKQQQNQQSSNDMKQLQLKKKQTTTTKPSSQSSSYQLYLSFLQIRPIKMTVSVSFDSLSQAQEQQRMNMYMLNLLPVGIQNAIITIDSYMFHHIYEDKNQVLKQIREFYTGQLTKQVLVNAGNLEFLVAIDLVKGLGIGVKNIFYDPIYEFASKKDIKNTTSTLLEGLFSLVLFIISIFIKILNLIFKIIAAFTFSSDFKAKRQIFRKQIFKSPLDGAVFGGKYFVKIFTSFKHDFVRFPKQYYEDYSVFGWVFGVILGILNVFPWTIKLFVTIYDMLYVIGLGFVSWGHYEENAMKTRSRPIRVFHKKKLVRYNLLQAKAYEILRQHNISLTQKQNILYVRDVDSVDKKSSYLILSDYSLLYCDNRLSIFDEIILYKIHTFTVIYPQQKQQKSLLLNNKKSVYLQIKLKSPNVKKYFFIQFSKYSYKVKFKTYAQVVQLLDKLEQLKQRSQSKESTLKQRYNYEIIDERRKHHKKEKKELGMINVPLEYKEMDYLQQVDPSENNILNYREFQNGDSNQKMKREV